MDANFRLKNQLVSNYSQDPGLGIGWAYMIPRIPYETYVLSRAGDEDVSGFLHLKSIYLMARLPRSAHVWDYKRLQRLIRNIARDLDIPEWGWSHVEGQR